MMDPIFYNLPCVFIYLDDLLVASRDGTDHRSHLAEVFAYLHHNSMVINLDK
jgi:hypothetical protein